MQINVNEKSKLVTLWFNSNENPLKELSNEEEEIIEEYRDKKYRICMFQSGIEDIRQNVLKLILNNVS